eukprot:2564557-Amphidinium_carterae.1
MRHAFRVALLCPSHEECCETRCHLQAYEAKSSKPFRKGPGYKNQTWSSGGGGGGASNGEVGETIKMSGSMDMTPVDDIATRTTTLHQDL